MFSYYTLRDRQYNDEREKLTSESQSFGGGIFPKMRDGVGVEIGLVQKMAVNVAQSEFGRDEAVERRAHPTV